MASSKDIADLVRTGAPLPLHWDLLLRSAMPITRLGMALRHLRPAERVAARVISFGNITAGGTGKTPAVIARVLEEQAAGHRVAVVTRGYGSARVQEPFVADAGLTRAELARLVGDEPALIRHHAPECVLVKAARRIDGARVAVDQLGCDVVVLDDAFQHVQLARDENVCLIDATNPFGNGHLVPRGILREPVDALRRATGVLLTRCDQARDLDGLVAKLRAKVPGIPLQCTVHEADGFWRVADGAPLSMEALEEGPVTAVSGIGNPEAFHRTLRDLGLIVGEARTFPDHGAIPPEALRAEGVVVITEKDAMRLGAVPDNVVALRVVLRDSRA